MPTVEISVNGRRHAVQCGPGEEQRVKRLAAYVDRKVSELARGSMQIGDTRLLLMASLMVADELSDAFDEIKRLQGQLDGSVAMSEEQAASTVMRIAKHIDAIAAQLEST